VDLQSDRVEYVSQNVVAVRRCRYVVKRLTDTGIAIRFGHPVPECRRIEFVEKTSASETSGDSENLPTTL